MAEQTTGGEVRFRGQLGLKVIRGKAGRWQRLKAWVAALIAHPNGNWRENR